ncbi:hypothetical protein GQ600_11338 [Phytophthora cactorum]|nr:hypothetical protein GQ600_11338 [Phytophthora cactorum]
MATRSARRRRHRLPQSTHVAQLVDEWRVRDTQPKRRQRARKVCSLMKGAKPHTTAYIYLCMRPRHVIRGALTTCFDVWHKEWSDGKLIPTNQDRSICMRHATLTRMVARAKGRDQVRIDHLHKHCICRIA